MEVVRWVCVHFVSIQRQKIRKNSKTNETIRKDKIASFQELSAQLLDIKQLTKTSGHESLLPSHSETSFLANFLGNTDGQHCLILCKTKKILLIPIHSLRILWKTEILFIIRFNRGSIQ
jgi:hypothetical protein